MSKNPAEPAVPADAARLHQLLSDWFAPWVQELGLRVESFGDGEATVRLPFSERLARIGGP